MLIVMETAGNYVDLSRLPEDTVILSKRRLFGIERNIVVEDLRPYMSLPGILLREGFNSITYTYITLERQIQRILNIVNKDEYDLIIAYGTSGFDIGVTLSLVKNCFEVKKNIGILIIVDDLEKVSTRNKVKLYVFLKLLLIMSSFYTVSGRKLFITIVEANRINIKALTYIARILYEIIPSIESSGLHVIGFRRFILPIDYIKCLIDALKMNTEIKELENSVKIYLALLNKILDKASAAFWEKARRNRDDVWPIKYVLRNLGKQKEKLTVATKVLVTTLDNNIITIKPNKKVLSKIALNIIKNVPLQTLFSDEEFVADVLANFSFLKENMYYPLNIELKDITPDKVYLVISNELYDYVEKYIEKFFLNIDVVRSKINGLWFMVFGFIRINVFGKLPLSPFSKILGELEDIHSSSLNVIITIDEIYPKNITLGQYTIPIDITMKIILYDVDSLYYLLKRIMDKIEMGIVDNEVLDAIRYITQHIVLISRLTSFPTYYYLDLLKKLKSIEYRYREKYKEQIEELYSILNYLKPM